MTSYNKIFIYLKENDCQVAKVVYGLNKSTKKEIMPILSLQPFSTNDIWVCNYLKAHFSLFVFYSVA